MRYVAPLPTRSRHGLCATALDISTSRVEEYTLTARSDVRKAAIARVDLRCIESHTMTKLGEPNSRGGKFARRFRSYMRRQRITCAKIHGYFEHSERKLGKPEKSGNWLDSGIMMPTSCRQTRMDRANLERPGL